MKSERVDMVEQVVEKLYAYRVPFLLLIQVLLIVVANQAAFWLRFDGNVPPEQQPYNTSLLPLLIVTRLAVFFPMRLHRGVWRYASIWDLRNITIGVIASSAMFWAITHGVLGIELYPRSVFVIDAIVLIFLMGGVRLSRRLYAASSHTGTRRVLVYGAGDAGEMIVRDMLSAKFNTTPIGFVDDDVRKIGQHIHGIAVLGDRKMLPTILDRYSPDELLIAIPSANPKTLREIVRSIEPNKIRITTLPRLPYLTGSVDVGQIRQLQVEDLLAREPVGLEYGPVREFLADKRILVTGAGGSIGSELCRQIAAAQPSSLVLVDRYENGLFQIHNELKSAFAIPGLQTAIADITDERRINQLFAHHRPQVVFHAAAHKHVPLMEENPSEAVKNNVRGTRIVAEASLKCDVEHFVLISTDKAVNPTSVMGATKRVAELVIEGLRPLGRTRFAAVRFGNVLGSNGSVVPTFLRQIASGGPVTVTHPEMRRFFMLIPEAVQLVLHAATLRDSASLFVLEMGEQVKVADMARDLIRLSGLVPDKDIEIRFTGIRLGEKLFEELVGDDEYSEESSLDKILRVHPKVERRLEGLPEPLARLEALALNGSDDQVLSELRSLLVSFVSIKESSPV